jgi:hypothetical protein
MTRCDFVLSWLVVDERNPRYKKNSTAWTDFGLACVRAESKCIRQVLINAPSTPPQSEWEFITWMEEPCVMKMKIKKKNQVNKCDC